MRPLYSAGVPDPNYPSLAHRVAYLFDSGTTPYKRRPELVDVVPPELYERGRWLATRLAESASPTRELRYRYYAEFEFPDRESFEAVARTDEFAATGAHAQQLGVPFEVFFADVA